MKQKTKKVARVGRSKVTPRPRATASERVLARALVYVRVLAGYECSGEGDVLCGECATCAARAFLAMEKL